jgi:hypothetical protein
MNALQPEFFVQTLFRQLFSSYMYVVKAAKTMFVRKMCAYNVDEIECRKHTIGSWPSTEPRVRPTSQLRQSQQGKTQLSQKFKEVNFELLFIIYFICYDYFCVIFDHIRPYLH